MIATADIRRRAFSVVEFIVIAVIFGIGVVTLYALFWQSSEEAFKSKWSYLAAHAAREEMEALRTLNLFGKNGAQPYAGHDWRPLGGSMLVDIGDAGANGAPAGMYDYPTHYSRIETKVEIQGDPASKVLTALVYVRYQEMGDTQYGFQAPDGSIKAIGTYRTLIVDRDTR
ncbi:MAG: hypothetical protein HUU06_02670 [Planctomycetaceae bacterium]|nr:hypothetical protein [Planctomycetaceae bacterium]